MPPAIVFAAARLKLTHRVQARLAQIEQQPFVVAADGGATTALLFGYQPDVVIGDFDSLDPATLARLEQARVPIETFARDKDATDGQLAIRRALRERPDELWLLGFLGGPRLDQALANVLQLADLEVPAVMLDEQNEARVIRPGQGHVWRAEPEEVISLIPLRGHALGVTTRGLRWALRDETLRQGDTRGISNEPVADEVSVSITDGLLLITRYFAA